MKNHEELQTKAKQRQTMTPQQLRRSGLITAIIGVALAIMFVVILAVLHNWRILISAGGPVILVISLGIAYLVTGLRTVQKDQA